MSLLVILGLLGAAFFAPLDVLEITDGRRGVIYRSFPQEGREIALRHINSIYEAEVEEVLEIRDGHFILKEVRTESYGVKEYYGITEGLPKITLRDITFHNSAGRAFQVAVDGRPIRVVDKFRNSRVTLRISSINLFRLLIEGTDTDSKEK